MKPKAVLKITIDVLMTLGLLFLMGYQLWGETAHEWVGAVMFLLFIAHHVLNAGWYGRLFTGRYSPARILQLTVDALLSLCMVGLMVSGIMLSNRVFAFLNIHSGISFARLLHMASSHWGFVLMALHLGLHWGMFVGVARRVFNLHQPSRARKTLLRVLGGAIASYGLIAFIRRDLLDYMLVRTQFVFLDFGEPIPIFYIDYVAVMGVWICLGFYAAKLLSKPSGKWLR